MRLRTRSTITTLGVLVTAGLAVGAPLAVGEHPESLPTATPAHADPAAAASARLARLDQEADAAGLAAQRADEAMLQHRTASTEAAAADAESALVAVARAQDPQLTAIARVLGPEVVANGGEVQPDATSVLSSRSSSTRAVSFAHKQIGKPYRFAGSGLGAYDCSGLTMRSYQSVGRGIGGHSATAQWRQAQRQHRLVSYGHKRAGDLIFYGRPGAVYHVAIYAGNGRMIEAPYPGKRVREVPVRSAGRLAQVGRPA